MSPKKRFSYVSEAQPDVPAEKAPEVVQETAAAPSETLASLLPGDIEVESLKSVPRRQGRTQQKEQLNIRIPRDLKRLAQAQAALEGRTIGDLVEELLIRYVDKASK